MNKKAQLIVDKTLVIILAILVIILVAGIFIYFNPNFLYNLLPNYNAPSETGDEIIQGADALTSACETGETLVARIGSGSARQVPIYFGENSKVASSLYYKKTGEDTADLLLVKEGLNRVVGTISSGKVSVYDVYLDSMNSVYTENLFSDSPFILNPKELSYLEESNLRGYAYFCKDSSGLLSKFYPRYFESSNVHFSPILSVTKTGIFQKKFCKIDIAPLVYCSSFSSCKEEYLFIRKNSESTFYIYLKSRYNGNVRLFSVANDGSVWIDNDIGLSGNPPNIADFRAFDWRVDSARGVQFGPSSYKEFRETSLVLDNLYDSFNSICDF